MPKNIEDISNAFAEFKTANDERLKQIEAKGSADPLTEKKVDDLNGAVSKMQTALDAEQKRTDDMQLALERKDSEGTPEETKAFKDGAKSLGFMTGRKVSVDEYKEYTKAFENEVRTGSHNASPEALKALSVGSDPDGGYHVTPDMNGRMIGFIRETSPMREICNVQTITTDSLVGSHDLDETTAGWVGETESRTETTTPQVGKWEIRVHEHYAEPRSTQQFLDDAGIDVEGWLAGKVAEKFARIENAVFLTGNGVGKPRGILDYATSATATSSSTFGTALQHVLSGNSGAFAATNGGDALINLVFELKAFYRSNARFLMNRSTLAEVRKLKDGDGNYLWTPDFEARQGGNLLGFGITEAEDMPDMAGDSLSIGFGDFNAGYQIVDRQGVRILRDNLTAKPYVKFYTTKRVGGDVVNFDAIKLMKFAS